MNKEAFKIAVPDAVLTDLRQRLSRVRYPIDFANENWAYGSVDGVMNTPSPA